MKFGIIQFSGKNVFHPIISSELRYHLLLVTYICGIIVLHGCDSSTYEPPWVLQPTSRDEYPAWSPDGQWICYYHESINPRDTIYPTGLYLVDTLGQNRRLVISGIALAPDWSPEGTRIAFDGGDLFTISPQGNDLIQVTNIGRIYFPTWSPDGTKLAFDTGYKDPKGSGAIWIINADGTGLTDISHHGTGEWRYPDWSPDGIELVHCRFIGVGYSELFRMDTAGKNPVRLTNDNFMNEQYPRWSPDGKYIAWTRFGSTTSGIWVMRGDGTNQRKLTDGVFSSWSTDSKRIVYSGWKSGNTAFVLWIINIDGSGRKQLTQ